MGPTISKEPALTPPGGDHAFEAGDVRYLPPFHVYPSLSPGSVRVYSPSSQVLCALFLFLSISGGMGAERNHSVLGEGVPHVRKTLL